MSADLRTAPSASTLSAPSPSAPGSTCAVSGPGAFSVAPEGSSDVPRSAAAWVHGTALPAVATAADEVQQALDRSADSFQGVSGNAYALHAWNMLHHLEVLAEGLTSAAVLFDSYADRLAAHEALLRGVRAQAVAAGFPVSGDLVAAPAELPDSEEWSRLAAGVAAERRSLWEWVAANLDAAVAGFRGEETYEWVGQFFATHHSTLASGALGTTLQAAHLRRVADTDRGGVRPARLANEADRLGRLGAAVTPVTVGYDTVVALESDEPGLGMAQVSGGVIAAGVVLALPISGVVVSGLAVTAATVLTVEGVGLVWGELPDEWTDTLDESIGEGWDDLKDVAGDAAGKVWSWVS